MTADVHRPGFDFAQEDVHLAGFQLGRMAERLDRGDLAGHDVYPDGSIHTVTTYGEAMDSGDKATNKAMSIAYKYAAFQAFCIPTEETAIDADAETHQVQPADADQILAEFTQYASTENDSKKLQAQYATTWSRLNGFADHQAKCKDVTGIRLKELKQAA